jgi:hypothetical protein
MPAMAHSRWHVSQLGVRPTARARPTRWRSYDLRGPLAPRAVSALVTAIKSLPTRGPWPEVDEEAWWSDVLADRRLRRSTAKALSDKDDDARQRLDRLPARSLTFSCKLCGQRATLTIAELIRTFGAERNVRTVGRHVLRCRDKGARREGEDSAVQIPASSRACHRTPSRRSWRWKSTFERNATGKLISLAREKI